MSDWSKAKYQECTRTEDTVPGISPLQDQNQIMGKSFAYVVEGKKIPNSNVLFYGIVSVPEDMNSGAIFTKIANVFGGNQTAIRGLAEKQIEGTWKDFEEAKVEKEITETVMPQECWKRIGLKQPFTVAELKGMINQFKSKNTSQQTKQTDNLASDPNTNKAGPSDKDQNPSYMENKKKDVQNKSNQASKLPVATENNEKVPPQLALPMPVSQELSKSEMNVTDKEDTGDKEISELFWGFIDSKGNAGTQYFFDAATQKQLIQIIANNPDHPPAHFFLESAIMLVPILKQENLVLRGQVDQITTYWHETKMSLQAMTNDRDQRVRAEMEKGTKMVGEVGKVRHEKEVLEWKVQGLEQEVASLTKAIKLQEEKSNLVKMMEDLSLTTKNINEKVDALKETSERTVAIVGADKEKAGKFGTPAIEKLAGIGGKFTIVAQEGFFNAVKSYKSLSRDLEKLIRNKTASKMVLCGDGLDMAMDLLKQKNMQGGWEKDSMIVFVIDGAEVGCESDPTRDQKKNEAEEMSTGVPSKDAQRFLESVAGVLSMALSDSTVKAILLVAGPANVAEKLAAKKSILSKFVQEHVTKVNVAEREGDEAEHWRKSEGWSALSAANMFTTIAWWREEGSKKASGDRVPPESCTNCGFIHDVNDCLQNEVQDANGNQVGVEKERNDRKPPHCNLCDGSHFAICRGKYCRPCNRRHFGPCTDQSSGRGGSDPKRRRKNEN